MSRHEVELWNRALSRVGEKRLKLPTAISISSATAANPVVVTTATHGFAVGDHVLILGLSEETELNNRVFRIGRDTFTSTTFSLDDEDGSGYTAETTGATNGAFKLPDNEPTRICFEAWEEVRDEILASHPWQDLVKRSRLSRLDSVVTVSAATNANPVVCTASTHGYSTGDTVLIEAMDEMIEVNNRYFTITKVDDDSFQLDGEDGTDYTAESTGGTAKKALTPLKPDSTYGAYFPLPTDSARILELMDYPSEETWIVEGDNILLNTSLTEPVRYIRNDLFDVSQYGSQLTNTLIARMAKEIAHELTVDPDIMKVADEEWRVADKEARRINARQQSKMPFKLQTWETARDA